ncbi:hypothetical protein KY363_07045 [Candidatus Woesearchaeota archaeon]|nr:hypothetical protein [Candidatus Woesearchaeota archaeon]
MKKAGEKAKSFAVHAVFVLLVLGSLYFIAANSPSITGHAVLNASTAKAKLETALESTSMFSKVSVASICVVINDADQPLSLQAVKDSTGWTVSEMKDFCTGSTFEDIIVQFADYDSYSSVVDNPSPRAIASAAQDETFEILPSKYVEQGGNVLCDSLFKTQYCTALSDMASDDLLIEADLSCCIDQMTSAQKKLLEQHLQDGDYEDEQKVLEQPTTIAGMSLLTIGGLGGAALILIVVIIIVLKGHGSPKPSVKPSVPSAGMPGAMPAGTPQGMGMPGSMPQQMMRPPPREDPQITELRNYVVGAMSEGYTWDQLKTHLLEIGWDEQTADKVVTEAYQRLQGQGS